MKMKYRISRSGEYVKHPFDEYTQPFFHRGNDIGCLVFHGFTGTPANMRLVADALSEAGYTVLVPRLSGHATTLADMDRQSDEIWLNDAFSAYDRLIQEGCKSVFVMGLSMGGLLSTLVASTRPVTGVVLMSTPFRMQQYLLTASRFAAVAPFVYLDTPEEQLASFRPYNQTYDGMPTRRLKDLERLTIRARGALHKLTCPILVMQSAKDDKVDLRSVPITEYGTGSPELEIQWLMDSPHGCTYGPEARLVAQRAVAFVRQTIDKRERIE